MENINEILKDKSHHELEIIREDDLEDLCNILRLSSGREEAIKKMDVILDLNIMIRTKESELILNKIKNG